MNNPRIKCGGYQTLSGQNPNGVQYDGLILLSLNRCATYSYPIEPLRGSSRFIILTNPHIPCGVIDIQSLRDWCISNDMVNLWKLNSPPFGIVFLKYTRTAEKQIIKWINDNLQVNWVDFSGDFETLETELINKHKPLINLAKNPSALGELSELRKLCVQIANEL